MRWGSSLTLPFVAGYLCTVGIVRAACSSWWLGRRTLSVSVLVVVVLVVIGDNRGTSGGFRNILVACGGGS